MFLRTLVTCQDFVFEDVAASPEELRPVRRISNRNARYSDVLCIDECQVLGSAFSGAVVCTFCVMSNERDCIMIDVTGMSALDTRWQRHMRTPQRPVNGPSMEAKKNTQANPGGTAAQ